jgi:hypothetical protein
MGVLGHYLGNCSFGCYLYSNKFLLVTDHQPLKSLMESDKLTRKLARWALMLMEYDFKVVHRAGLVNMDADGLNRNPVPSQADATGARWHVDDGEDSLPGWHCSTFLCLLVMHGNTTEEATVPTVDEDGGKESKGARDIFEDVDVMKYLKEREVKATWSTKERDRVLQRAKWFVWERTHLLRLWPDGTKKVVPTLEERVKLIKHAQEDLRHFGVRRTYSLLQIHYWWRGMQQQVQALVARCVVCDRVRASFNAPMPYLQPLPIMGLGCRWSLDFAGPLPVTPRHNKYVLVMIEHFSKWIELVALPDKFNEGAAYSFLDRVLGHFGAHKSRKGIFL